MNIIEDLQENYAKGYIKIFRSLQKHWIWSKGKPLTKFEAWITMIMECNYKDNKVLIHGELIECKRGQSIKSLQSWANLFNWSIQQLRTFLKLLENDSMIVTDGLRKTTRITICNYDSYQSDQQANNTQLTSKQHTTNTQLTTNNKDKKEKESKEIYKYSKFYDNEILKAQNENNSTYLNFVDWLYTNNINKKPLVKVLNMQDQITYEIFLKYYTEFGAEKLKNTILNLENYNKKTYKSFNLTLNNWLNDTR